MEKDIKEVGQGQLSFKERLNAAKNIMEKNIDSKEKINSIKVKGLEV